MDNLFRLLTAVLCPAVLGFVCVSFIVKNDEQIGILERAALSFAIGAGGLSLLMFVCALLGVKFPVLYLTLCLLAALTLILAIKNNLNNIKDHLMALKRRPSLPQIIILLPIFLIFLSVSFHALIKPLSYWDSWAIYGFKAKALYLAQGLPLNFFTDSIKDYAHLDYPLLLPMLEAWVYTALNSWNDQLVSIIFLFYFLSLLIIFYFNLKPFLGAKFSLLLTLFLVTVPRFTNFMASSGYADVPLAVYYFMSLAYLIRWFYAYQRGAFLYLSAICLGLGAWSKNEGAVICVINFFLLFSLVLARNKFQAKSFLLIVRCAGIILVIIFPWLVFKGVFHISGDLINSHNLSLEVLRNNLSRLPLIFKYFLDYVSRLNDWNLLWFVTPLAIALGFKKAFSLPFLAILLSLLLYFLSGVFIYIISPYEINWHLANSMERLLIQMAPLALFLFGLLAAAALQRIASCKTS